MAGRVEIIKKNKKILQIEDDKKTLNVAYYCRVSSDKDDQKNSLDAQKLFFEMYSSSQTNWNTVGVFADEGISGTSLKKRDKFNTMVALAKAGAIDLIITKEVSRFARNTLDALSIVEDLRNHNVYVYFMTDDINTESNDYREKFNKLAAEAESESLKTSRRVKFGHQLRMKQGVIFGRREIYGYNVLREGRGIQQLEIIPEEAEVVKLIFKLYSEGYGTFRISKILQEKGIKAKYKNGWSNTVILRILRQEKYVGDLLQQKTYTPDFLTHAKKYNYGEEDKYYIRDHHPESAIIDRELWDKVQQMLKDNTPSDEMKAKHSNRYWTSGKIFCSECKSRYVRKNRKLKSGEIYVAWNCFENARNGYKKTVTVNDEKIEVGCDNKRVNDKILREAIHDIVFSIYFPQIDKIKKELLKNIKNPVKNKINISQIEKQIDTQEKKLLKLTDLLINGRVEESTFKLKEKEINNNLFFLKEELSKCQNMNTQNIIDNNEYIKQLDEIANLTEEKFDDIFLEKITKRIIVHPDKILEIYLTCYPKPIFLQYQTKGKGKTYHAEFEIIKGPEI